MTRVRRARRGLAVVVALAAVSASACAAIPQSSPVVAIGSDVQETQTAPVLEPPAGIDPLLVVRSFIEAAASPANDYAAARAYLTDEAAETWDESAQTIVLEEAFNTVYSTSPGDSGTAEFVQVRLRGQQVGDLAPDGSFTSRRDVVSPTMDLVTENGEWRISQPPVGKLVRVSDFGSSYRPVGVKFVDPVRNTLVTDRRLIPAQPAANWPSRVVDLLLAGPSAAVKDAAVNLLADAQINTNVVIGEDDVLTVDLTGLPDLTEPQRRLAAAQIVSTVRDVVPQRVRIFADGSALVPGKPEWTGDDAVPYTPDDSVKPGLPALAVSGARVVRADDDGGIEGPAGAGLLAVRSAAQSFDGELFAVVTQEAGGPRLQIGPPTDLVPVPMAATDSMTRPTWRRGAAEVWTVINDGRTGVAVVRADTGELRLFDVDVNELAVKGSISELRLSRDGVRVAAIVDGALYVGIVSATDQGRKVLNPRLLVAPGAPQMVDVDWRGSDRLVVATRDEANPTVYEVTIDGQSWREFSGANLTGPLTGVAAAFGRDVFVGDQTALWSAGDIPDVWYSQGFGQRADPFYPG